MKKNNPQTATIKTTRSSHTSGSKVRPVTISKVKKNFGDVLKALANE